MRREWWTADEIAAALHISVSAVYKRAAYHGWARRKNDGRVLYAIRDVIPSTGKR